MIICVRLFAAAKQIAGHDELELDLPQGATVADLRATFQQQFPELEALLNHARFSVNAEFADDRTELSPTDEVACIPPVSGG